MHPDLPQTTAQPAISQHDAGMDLHPVDTTPAAHTHETHVLEERPRKRRKKEKTDKDRERRRILESQKPENEYSCIYADCANSGRMYKCQGLIDHL